MNNEKNTSETVERESWDGEWELLADLRNMKAAGTLDAEWLSKLAEAEIESKDWPPPSKKGDVIQLDVPNKDDERFKVWSYDDLQLRPQTEWLIKGVLPKAELGVLFGEPGSGKSFAAFDLCCAVERGTAWGYDKITVKRGRTLYVFAEGGSGAHARYAAYAERNGDGALPGAILDAPNLLTNDAARLIQRIEHQGGADLVVVDTLAASIPGGDENGGKDMGTAIEQAKRIHRETGALVLLVHHSGKDVSKGARGWSGLKAAADCEFQIKRSGDFRQFKISKLKDGRDGNAFSFKLRPVVVGMDEDGDDVTSCVVEHLPAKSQIPAGVRGKYVGIIREVLSQMNWEDGREISTQEVIDKAKELCDPPAAGKKDFRGGTLKKHGLEKLVEAGEVTMRHSDLFLCKAGTVEVGDWDD